MSAANPRALLERLLDGGSLTEAEAAAVLGELAAGAVEPPLAGALLAALRAKGETPEEIRGFARGMRALAVPPALPATPIAVDIVGTGGDGSGSLNLSTGAALLAAACGVPVVKHGNRSVSSRSGSADVLAALNPALPPAPEDAGGCLDALGFTFLFAPHFHPAMKAIAPVRQAMKVRTVFNVLGPLTNPAAPRFCVLGAYSAAAASLMAQALAGLPVERAFVVHGEPGWDEATPCGCFDLFEVRDGRVRHERRDPLEAGIARCAPEALAGGDAGENARRLRAALGGEADEGERAHRDALVLGAALALEVTGGAEDLPGAVAHVRAQIDSGRVSAWMRRFEAYAAGAVAGGEAGP